MTDFNRFWSVEERNTAFLDIPNNVDEAIQTLEPIHPSSWRALIGRSAFTFGHGITQRGFQFYGPKSQRMGMQNWRAIQLSSKPSGADQGYDSSDYNPYTLRMGWKEYSYGGFEFDARTEAISVKDLKYGWQMQQQIAAYYQGLPQWTMDMWENASRELYLSHCNTANRIFVMTTGGIHAVNASYNPFSTDADGDNVMTLPIALDGISPLNWRHLTNEQRFLQMRAPLGSVGQINGRPQFPLMIDLEDFHDMLERDDKMRTDWNYAKPTVMIDGYGAVDAFQGFAMTHDIHSPRGQVKSSTSTQTVIKRIDPETVGAAELEGVKVDVNQEYLRAQIGVAIIMVKEVYEIQVEPNGPTTLGSGTQFGSPPGLEGQWMWKIFENEHNNVWGENGAFYMRAAFHPKPLLYHMYPAAFVYARQTLPPAKTFGSDGHNVAASRRLRSDMAAGDRDVVNDHNTLVVTLTGNLNATATKRIRITDDAAVAIEGVIADGSQAPTYKLALFSTPSAHTAYTAAGPAKVEVI